MSSFMTECMWETISQSRIGGRIASSSRQTKSSNVSGSLFSTAAISASAFSTRRGISAVAFSGESSRHFGKLYLIFIFNQ